VYKEASKAYGKFCWLNLKEEARGISPEVACHPISLTGRLAAPSKWCYKS
jgi:hypothetical protein